ncbi:MAG TPA: FAD/NAD(P)-binding protein [Candidatus Sulfotelmatobacter sp.]|nr:FAD/NAD(P)-binding protein [Candidatus Sulfotelmatobacter sp.]
MPPAGFSFVPGQFNMLYLFGAGEVPISISGDPAETSTIQHTIRAVGTVTSALTRLKKGDTIGMRGPFGSPWPLAEAAGKDCLIVGGAIGLAPLRPVIYRILAEREKYRRVVILYGSRTHEDILYARELEHWRGKFDLDIQLTIDYGGPLWRGNVGVVTTLIARAPIDPANTIALVCGPEVMMRFTWMELQSSGIPPERVYLSMERNMKCAVGFCGHCQFGPTFVCKDGPVFRLDRIAAIFGKPEI